VDPIYVPMESLKFHARSVEDLVSASIIEERHSARSVEGRISACITDSSTAAKSVKDLPFANMGKTRAAV